MALDFPASPTNGQVFAGYQYDSATGAWQSFNAATPGPYLLGAIYPWASPTIPSWGLELAGQTIVGGATTYSGLAALHPSWVSGANLVLPNWRGRTVVGQDPAQTEFDTLGEVGGAKTHTLTNSEIPSHNHTFSATTSGEGAHTHTFSATTSTTGAHAHNVSRDTSTNTQVAIQTNATGGTTPNRWILADGINAGNGNIITNSVGDHAHTLSGTTSAGSSHTHTVSGTTGNAGTGGAHNNLQPYVVARWVVCAVSSLGEADPEVQTAIQSRVTQLEVAPPLHTHVFSDISVTSIGSGVDLNDYVFQGLYTQNLSANAAAGFNYPTPSAGLLEVFSSANDNFKYQRYTVFNGGTVYQRTYYSSGWAEWFELASVQSAYRLKQTLTFTSSTTFDRTAYPWLRALMVKVQAGGGAGGGAALAAASQHTAGSGGGGGGYAEAFIEDLAGLSNPITVTIGSGGTAVSGAAGNAGGSSTFGGIVSASGGGGGATAASSALSTSALAGAGGVGTAGAILLAGSAGALAGGNATLGIGGSGGSSPLGGGGAGGYTASGSSGSTGSVGRQYGGGGGGSSNNSGAAARAGGAGAAGIIILEMYA